MLCRMQALPAARSTTLQLADLAPHDAVLAAMIMQVGL
jgi:hypothetical protein